MANINRPFGLRPVRYLNGAPYNGAVGSYHVPATNLVNMFLGDPVILNGTGNLTSFMDYPPGVLADVQLTTIPAAGLPALTYANYLIGSIIGILPVTRESTIYRAAGVEAIIFVTEDPMIVYQIQDNGAATLGTGVIGQNANLFAGAGSTTTGQSGYTLDAGTTTAPGVAAGLQLTVIKGSFNVTNDVLSPFATWDVIINQHPFGQSSIGI